MMKKQKRIPSQQRLKTGKGSVFVETSLIFTVFAFMVIGAFDFGRFLFTHQALVERARVSARWGAINDPTNTDSIRNMVLYNQSTRPSESAPTYFNLSTDNVSVSTSDYGTDNYRLTVQVSGYSYTMLSPYIGGTKTGLPITVSVALGLFN